MEPPPTTLTLVDDDGDKLVVRNRADSREAEGLHLRIAQRSDAGNLSEAGFYLSEDALRQLLEWYQMTRPVTDV